MRLYYGSIRIEGRARVPLKGPLLVVVNHPNSLLDAAAVLVAVPRPLSFAAKHTLFAMPVLGFVLRRLGAVPIYRPKDGGNMARANLETFREYIAQLRGGGAGVIFPEGLSHDDPELKPIRSGPSRIVLGAEQESEFQLGVHVLPVGLNFEPRQQFRGDVTIHIGEPFTVMDLHDRPRREAIREVQERIGQSLRPLVFHLDHIELEPLVRRVAEIYEEHQHGEGGAHRPVPRGELLRLVGTCLNHYLVADPEHIEELQKRVERCDRLTRRAGVTNEMLREKRRPFLAFARFLALGLGIAVGFPFFVWGCLTGLVPYRLAAELGRRWARDEGQTTLPLYRLLAGLVTFGVWWGLILFATYRWSNSWSVTAIQLVAMALCGLHARAYAAQIESWRERMGILFPLYRNRRKVERVAEARESVLVELEASRRRYFEEEGEPLIAPRRRKWWYRVPWRRLAVVVGLVATVGFLYGLRDRDVSELNVPSLWTTFRGAEAPVRVTADARGLAGILDAMLRLENEMRAIRADFRNTKSNYYEPKDNDRIRNLLRTYLVTRKELFRLTCFYRRWQDGPAELQPHAFLVAYGAALELCARGMQFLETFDGDDNAIGRINEAAPLWNIPGGSYDRIMQNLASTDVLDALAEARAQFEHWRSHGRFPKGEPWEKLVTGASRGGWLVNELGDKLLSYKFEAAWREMLDAGEEGRYRVQSVISTWMGDARVRTPESGDGLLAGEVEKLRPRLRPGDILIERRNWYLSNAFLPGFWPHAAIYVGGIDGVKFLGIADDPRVDAGLNANAMLLNREQPDVIEAISEGVVFTSLDHSVGGADALCVLRPKVPREQVAEAVARAISHHGKAYDFDFDFFSNDRLVCTEVVYSAYQGILHFELPEIMGRKTLPAIDIVRKWSEERSGPSPELEFVAFYDMDELRGTSFQADADALVETLDRPALTILQTQRGAPPFPGPGVYLLVASLAAAVFVFGPRRRRT